MYDTIMKHLEKDPQVLFGESKANAKPINFDEKGLKRIFNNEKEYLTYSLSFEYSLDGELKEIIITSGHKHLHGTSYRYYYIIF